MPLLKDNRPDMQETCAIANETLAHLHTQYRDYINTMHSGSREGMKLRGITPKLYISDYLFHYLLGCEGLRELEYDWKDNKLTLFGRPVKHYLILNDRWHGELVL